MKPSVKISEVLHYAADVILAANELEQRYYAIKVGYTCTAIRRALNHFGYFFDREDQMFHIINAGLINMGLKNPRSVYCFDEFETSESCHTKEAQGARYLWLKWAALMAEEQEE